QGTETFPGGGKYEGEFKDGKKNGQGTRTWSDGSKYVGKFKDGLPNGKGKNTYTDGGWYEGSWKEGQSWTGITFDKDGNISYEKVNGKIQFKE
ncbi:MAG: MORN motif precursor, partial [Candidatus Poseidoniia archaeon]|nr:MORN motif precursor [Candidatus Poseidoniia archaeon]